MNAIHRSARSGRFVSKAEAEANREETILQKPFKLNSKTAKELAASASKIAGRTIDEATVMAVLRAYKIATRVK